MKAQLVSKIIKAVPVIGGFMLVNQAVWAEGPPATIPEPGLLALVTVGAAAAVLAHRYRKK